MVNLFNKRIGGLWMAAGLWVLGGCGDSPPLTLTSPDGQTRITVVENMAATDQLNDEASIQAANLFRELYVIVISEPKQDELSELTLAEFDDVVVSNMLGSLERANATSPKSVKIHGLDGLRRTIRGHMPGEKLDVGYVVTTVESADSFHQVIGWTLANRLDKYQATLERIADSFQSNDGPVKPAGTNSPGEDAATSAGQP